jgi:hypothetical protein
MEKVTDGLAHGMGKLGATSPVQKLVDFLKDRNYQRYIAAFVGVVLSSFYMLDTAKSKKIEKDQKLPLITNQAVVCGLSTLGAYTLDSYLDKKMENVITKFNIANISDSKTRKMFAKLYDNPEYLSVVKRASSRNQDLAKNLGILDKMFEFNPNIEKQLNNLVKKGTADEHVNSLVNQLSTLPKKLTCADGKVIDRADKAKELFMGLKSESKALTKIFNRQSIDNAVKLVSNNDDKLSSLMNGFKIAKSLMVFAMIYRFLSPVFATPLANGISEKIEARKKAQRVA